ncbi:ammonia-forming cytochrome c nitrite reductase subunit c552 [Selenomonas sp. TAMA-11512]|uniref:ammonia-forming cytochrome c nitrite reductase subunit c552 n=1 Tax=Selenomonas sp. TAMA-11512 TaxID=3095337 RepID=UPI003089B609|nr:ammonia-forming cytochrome c nitrite reductase subunit c552 [Selenomonas sp. TAMA-11512]
MSKLQKTLIGVLAVAVVFFGFVIVRIGIAKPASTFKLAQIPTEDNQHLSNMAFKEAYPLQYESYMRTAEQTPTPTGYGHSDLYSRILDEPEMVTNWAGYAFSLSYDDDRGHFYALYDVKHTRRTTDAQQFGSCITCKSSYTKDVFYDQMGWDYTLKPFKELADQVPDEASVGCATCHDVNTMKLRVMNPAQTEDLERNWGKKWEELSNNEQRALVCGQCHTEYYFEQAKKGRVIFPRDKGYTAEEMYQYYASPEVQSYFKGDFKNKVSGAMMLKAQHPDYDVWRTSVHADAGVTCVDCHMPYMRKDGVKYTSHYMSSPLKYVEEACLKCHDESKEVLIKRVKTIHDNTFKLQRTAGLAVAEAHLTIKAAMDAGATDEQLAQAREYVREAQWYWDYISAENGVGFHNPDQCMRTLGLSIDRAHLAIRAANAAVRGALVPGPMPTEPAASL